ncbi:Mu transposase C-terminal domain-containing protein [Bradyrhizobium sp. USDA 4529]
MNTPKQVILERKLSPQGLEVHGILYQSSVLRQLRSQIGTMSVQVKIIDPLDCSRIQVWHPVKSIWIEVAIPASKRPRRKRWTVEGV